MAQRKPRTAGEDFPYDDPTVPFITFVNGNYTYACKLEEKIELLNGVRLARSGGYSPPILAVWPGKKRSDAFFINFAEALHRLVPRQHLIDFTSWKDNPEFICVTCGDHAKINPEDGNEWGCSRCNYRTHAVSSMFLRKGEPVG